MIVSVNTFSSVLDSPVCPPKKRSLGLGKWDLNALTWQTVRDLQDGHCIFFQNVSQQRWLIAYAVIFLLRKREASEGIMSHNRAGLNKMTVNITVSIRPKNLFGLSLFFNDLVHL